jgi:hypothetical protein
VLMGFGSYGVRVRTLNAKKLKPIIEMFFNFKSLSSGRLTI